MIVCSSCHATSHFDCADLPEMPKIEDGWFCGKCTCQFGTFCVKLSTHIIFMSETCNKETDKDKSDADDDAESMPTVESEDSERDDKDAESVAQAKKGKFICPYCDKEYAIEHSFYRHRKNCKFNDQAKKEEFDCPDCGTKLSTKDSLLRHRKRCKKQTE
jgi:uncharacterized Zn-finger protein